MYPRARFPEQPRSVPAVPQPGYKVQQTPPLNQAWLGLVQEALGDQPCRWA